jgi:hypothetical protein
MRVPVPRYDLQAVGDPVLHLQQQDVILLQEISHLAFRASLGEVRDHDYRALVSRSPERASVHHWLAATSCERAEPRLPGRRSAHALDHASTSCFLSAKID